MTDRISTCAPRRSRSDGLRRTVTAILPHAAVVGADMFVDLRSRPGFGTSSGSNIVTPMMLITVASLSGIVLHGFRFPPWSVLKRPAMLADRRWFSLDVVTSVELGIALRRAATSLGFVTGASATIAGTIIRSPSLFQLRT